MCQKNDYTRRVVTVLLAVITALFVFGAMQISAQVATRSSSRLKQSAMRARLSTTEIYSANFNVDENELNEGFNLLIPNALY